MCSAVAKAIFGVNPKQVHTLVPGLLAATGLAVFAMWISTALGESLLGYDKSPISSVMIAILLGLLAGNLVALPRWIQPGVAFSVKKILRWGIILLGIRLSFLDVFRLGAVGIPVVLACIAGALAVTSYLARRLALPPRLGTLIGVGTSICGVSAIVAAAPGIDARDEEVAYAVAVITMFGMFATLAYPYIAHALFGGEATRIGLFLGTSVHDTSQVTGAAMVYAQVYAAPRALDIAVVTKLVRNVFMVGVIPLTAVLHARRSGQNRAGSRPSFYKLLPLFVLGFLLVSLLRSIGDAGLNGGGRALGLMDTATWNRVVSGIKDWAGYFLVVALAGVGLSTRFRHLSQLGIRPFAVGLVAALLVGAISYAVVSILTLAGALPDLNPG